MKYLDVFPEVAALGQERLQALAEEWLNTPVARECGIVGVKLGDASIGYEFVDIQIDSGVAALDGEVFHFPADNWLIFVIEREMPLETRDVLKERLMTLRQKVGPTVYQRYKSRL